MQSIATRTRINQITIMASVSFLFFAFSNWEEAIWVVYSTLVVAGPMSTFLGFEKSKDRILGTLGGVFIAYCLEFYLRFNSAQVPVAAFIIALAAGFMATRPYKYFIFVITITVCLSYTYMNMPYTNFAPTSFMMDRSIGIFVGVMIFYLFQKFIFGTSNSKLELLEESHDTLTKLHETLLKYSENASLTTAYQSAVDVSANSKDLKSYIDTAHFIFGVEIPGELRFAKQVVMLNNRAIRLLIDEPQVMPNKIAKLLHIIELKLER